MNCLNDILHRQSTGNLKIEISAIVSNHETLREMTEWHKIPFHYLPITAETKEDQESKLLEIIKEFGYDYITDVLDLTTAQIRQLAQLISLIHFMKGHKDGLVLVLDLLGFVGSILTEWWEKNPQGTPDTFDMELNLNVSSIDTEAIIRLLAFVENYVYPVIEELTFVADVLTAEIYMHGTVDVIHRGTIVETL